MSLDKLPTVLPAMSSLAATEGGWATSNLEEPM